MSVSANFSRGCPRGRRDFPNETFHVEGPQEVLSKGGTFAGRGRVLRCWRPEASS